MEKYRVGAIGGKTLIYYMCTTAFAVTLALILATLSKGMFVVLDPSGASYTPAEAQSVMDTIVNIFPSNFVKPMAEASMLQVMVIALFVGFGILLAAGFFGGHGTAAAVGSTFSRLGFADANDIAMTFATAGILTGVLGGLIFIKIATKRGWTKYIKDFSDISDDMRTGLIPEKDRESMGKNTISSVALDPLAFHLALLLLASGLGQLAYNWIYSSTGLDLPTYLLAFLIALALFYICKATGIGKYIDEDVISRISGTATDYLVFFGIASINLSVIVKYAVPLLMLLVFGIFIVVINLLYFGPAMNRGSWFERSIFVYGYTTGVFAIGMILLRIVDKDNRSKTLNDTALTGALTTPPEVFAWGFGPAMLLHGQHWTFVAIYTALLIACIVVSVLFKWWWRKLPLDRPSEEEFVAREMAQRQGQ